MASLTNPINSQNIVDRFADYVVARGNLGIVWGTNAIPTADTSPTSAGVDAAVPVIASTEFGGDTNGKAIGISGGNLSNPISASEIYNTLLAETNAYTRIRLVRGVLNVTGGGGNTGTRLLTAPWPAYPPAMSPTGYINVYDSTQMANMSTTYLQSVTAPADGGVTSGSTANTANLETLFSNLQSALTTTRSNGLYFQVDVCHASCHSSCHSARGRR